MTTRCNNKQQGGTATLLCVTSIRDGPSDSVCCPILPLTFRCCCTPKRKKGSWEGAMSLYINQEVQASWFGKRIMQWGKVMICCLLTCSESHVCSSCLQQAGGWWWWQIWDEEYTESAISLHTCPDASHVHGFMAELAILFGCKGNREVFHLLTYNWI